jgi:hemolysin-activating ACP:hemolysin acyltransferase
MNPNLIEHYPLHDELEVISSISNLRPIIAIHDFYNPSHPNYSYDKDHGKPLNWEYIKDQVELIYPQDGLSYFYNEEASGNNVGIIYIGVEKYEI